MTIDLTAIVTGAIVTQVSLAVILLIGALVVRREWRAPFWSAGPDATALSWALVTFFLITVIALMATDTMIDTWQPLLGETVLPGGLDGDLTVSAVLFVDVAFLGWVVSATGGGMKSPFVPLLFALLPIAIFLQRDDANVIFIGVLTALTYSASLHLRTRSGRAAEHENMTVSSWVIAMLSFLLLALVGLLTG